MRFSVDLEVFHGPLDLLLYLVRKHELDVTDIPIARVTEQYLEYLAVLQEIDVGAVGNFLDVASLLIEIKSRSVLPGEEEVEEELQDPRRELVRRLLEYKQFRDAASMLEERSREWLRRYGRLANDLPARPVDPQDQPIENVDLWDLVSAFGRLSKQRSFVPPQESIRYDDTPIHIFMQRIDHQLRQADRVAFTALFDGAVHKSTLVGMFLAVLELMRHGHARARQDEPFGEIWLEAGPQPLLDEFTAANDYEHDAAA